MLLFFLLFTFLWMWIQLERVQSPRSKASGNNTIWTCRLIVGLAIGSLVGSSLASPTVAGHVTHWWTLQKAVKPFILELKIFSIRNHQELNLLCYRAHMQKVDSNFPNFHKYYLASHFRPIWIWLHSEDNENRWISIEQQNSAADNYQESNYTKHFCCEAGGPCYCWI